MATLKQLVDFAKEYHISQSEMHFHGEHDEVYIEIPGGLIPDPDDLPEEGKEYIADRYGILAIDGNWGFYT